MDYGFTFCLGAFGFAVGYMVHRLHHLWQATQPIPEASVEDALAEAILADLHAAVDETLARHEPADPRIDVCIRLRY